MKYVVRPNENACKACGTGQSFTIIRPDGQERSEHAARVDAMTTAKLLNEGLSFGIEHDRAGDVWFTEEEMNNAATVGK